MPQQQLFRILTNTPLTESVFCMELEGNTEAITAPGQFVNLRLDGSFLRRPISVCDWTQGRLTLIYKVVGRGTRAMSGYTPGRTLDVLVGLGNGYDLSPSGERPLLIGGGVGTPPLYGLCKRLLAQGCTPTVVLGFGAGSECFYETEFKELGAEVRVTTVDGSYGIRGYVTDALEGVNATYLYTCGPEPMLKAVYRATHIGGQYSFEERMGCGFGACMGCTCATIAGPIRICKEGPVLRREVIQWNA